jgi:hypothetical protein
MNGLEFTDFTISIDLARMCGLKWYFPGTTCPNGHIAKRYVSGGRCSACLNQWARMRRVSDPEAARAHDRRKYYHNVEHSRARVRAKYARHADKRRAEAQRKYREEPEHNKKMRQKQTEWRKANRGKTRELINRRKKQIKMATPRWLTASQRAKMRDLYIEAGNRAGEWHVDHIYPLRAKNSCGLHVPWNLQILSGAENRRKRNIAPEEIK